MIQAKRDKDTLKSSLLVTLLAEAERVGKDAGNRMSTDEEVSAVIKKFIKNMDETLKFTSSENILREKEILLGYLPKQLTKEELETIIKASALTTVPEVMKFLKQNHAGVFDGKMASDITKNL